MSSDPITFHPYMVYRGIAAEDLEKDSVVLLVVVPELMPNASSGSIGSGITEESISLQTRDGKPIISRATTANHIVATWDGHSNLRYPPFVRKGEPVEVYRTEGQDKYRWRTTGSGRDMRATDRVHIEVGATDPSKPGVQKDDTNTYSAYLDSANKRVGMKTSKANGEVAAFSMEANLAEGTFHISDDSDGVGNRIFLDTGTKSGTPILQFNLTTGITFKMEGKDLFIKVPGNLFGDIGGRAVLNSPLIVVNTEKKGAIIINAATIAINSAKDIILTASGVIGLNSLSTKIGGVLVAGSARIFNAVKGSFSSVYKPSTIGDPTKSNVNVVNNSPDVDVAGLPYRAP